MRIRLITQDGLTIETESRNALPQYFYMPKWKPCPVVPEIEALSLNATVEKREFIFSYIVGDTGYYYEIN